MPTVEIILPHHRYEVRIESGLLSRAGELVHAAAGRQRAAVLADANVAATHGLRVEQALRDAGYEVWRHPVPAGESNKNLDTVRRLYDVLLAARLERRSPVLAVGGGVIGDTVGFAAATFLRGVPLVQCPTTLLAMVDSSVGGKVGVDLPQGKNLVGAFHQPTLVIIDTDCLGTLPPRELTAGLAECIKHAVIRDAGRFAWLERNLQRIMRLEPAALVELVQWNVAIKAQVVMADEKETGERAHLNFGHTFGHAIEAATHYGPHLHGEAVSLGMVAAANLAAELGRCPADLPAALGTLLRQAGLPVQAADLPAVDVLMEAMRTDKKAAAGRLRFVLPTRLGAVEVASEVPEAAVRRAWATIRG